MRAAGVYIYACTYIYTIHTYAGGRYKAKVHLLNRSMKLAKRDIKCAIVAAAGRCACLSRPARTHCPWPRHLDGPAALHARLKPARDLPHSKALRRCNPPSDACGGGLRRCTARAANGRCSRGCGSPALLQAALMLKAQLEYLRDNRRKVGGCSSRLLPSSAVSQC